MVNDYINNFENMMSDIYFVSFKVVVNTLVVLLIFSLLMLGLGCLIKSQKIKSKFLIVVPILLLGNIFFITLPYVLVRFKNII